MTKVIWGATGDRAYEAGVDRGVFYPLIGSGVAWNGLLSVSETVDDSSQKVTYIDGKKYISTLSLGNYAADLSAITYPKEFEPYDGYSVLGVGHQRRLPFSLSYRTLLCNDVDNLSHGYQIHLVYNILASPTPRGHSSLNTSTDVSAFTWGLSTTPLPIDGNGFSLFPASHLIIDSTKVYPAVLAGLEDMLYGSAITSPKMPTIPEVMALFEANAIFQVTDNGDGTATITGPDAAVNLILSDVVELTWPTVIQLSSDTYQLSSL